MYIILFIVAIYHMCNIAKKGFFYFYFILCFQSYHFVDASTSEPGVCFLDPDNTFLGVVVFVDLRADEEVQKT